MFYRLVWMTCGAVSKLLLDLRSFGRRNGPRAGGVILAVNHASYLDPVVVGCSLSRPVHFMARRTLFWGPFGVTIRALHAFPVERDSVDSKALREYIGRVKAGNVVLLFPEGTRTRDGSLGPVKPGVGMLAARAGAPIVPTYVDGTFHAWPRQRLLPKRAHVTIFFGPPLRPERRPGEAKRAYHERIRDEIVARLRGLEGHVRSRRASTTNA